jgi:hypothetical protein
LLADNNIFGTRFGIYRQVEWLREWGAEGRDGDKARIFWFVCWLNFFQAESAPYQKYLGLSVLRSSGLIIS